MKTFDVQTGYCTMTLRNVAEKRKAKQKDYEFVLSSSITYFISGQINTLGQKSLDMTTAHVKEV